MALEYAPEIDHSADELASLLAQVPEYQEYIRLAQLIHLDPDVKRISMKIQSRQMISADGEGRSIEVLEAELETLPAVQALRKVEAALKDLFHSVDQVISAAAGVEFASNALPHACG
jgi:cell fate (sporulation/competence/biofilm development) regulator YlbF (YheA/YmcA/DUF963 family)